MKMKKILVMIPIVGKVTGTVYPSLYTQFDSWTDYMNWKTNGDSFVPPKHEVYQRVKISP